MMAMIGGRDRLPLLASKAKEMARVGPAHCGPGRAPGVHPRLQMDDVMACRVWKC